LGSSVATLTLAMMGDMLQNGPNRTADGLLSGFGVSSICTRFGQRRWIADHIGITAALMLCASIYFLTAYGICDQEKPNTLANWLAAKHLSAPRTAYYAPRHRLHQGLPIFSGWHCALIAAHCLGFDVAQYRLPLATRRRMGFSGASPR
jgi:hypothetical protein